MDQVSSLAELVECAVCTEELKDARILACHHSFCLQCINDVLNKGNVPAAKSLVCPTCRQRTKIPQGESNKLPVDFRSAQMKEVLSISMAQTGHSASQTGSSAPTGSGATETRPTTSEKSRFCDVCSSVRACKRVCTPAVAFCNQCTFMFCSQCLMEHSKNKLMSAHTVVSLTGEGSEGASTCKLHGNPASCFCVHCKESVCFVCMLAKEHANHEVESVETAHKQVMAELETVVSHMKTMCTAGSIGQEISCMSKELQEKKVSLSCQEVKNSINSRATAAITKINTSKRELLKEVQTFEANYKKEYSGFLAQLQKVHNLETRCADFGKARVCDDQLVTKKVALVNEIKNVSKDLPLKKPGNALPVFTPGNTINVGTVTIAASADDKPVSGVIRHTFENIGNFPDWSRSPEVEVRSLKWNVAIKKVDFHLGIHLFCNSKAKLSGQKCRVDADVTLVSETGQGDKTLKLSNIYTETSLGWGWVEFISLKDLFDPCKKFLNQNKIVVEVVMEVFKSEKNS
jgi:hypothetical protein